MAARFLSDGPRPFRSPSGPTIGLPPPALEKISVSDPRMASFSPLGNSTVSKTILREPPLPRRAADLASPICPSTRRPLGRTSVSSIDTGSIRVLNTRSPAFDVLELMELWSCSLNSVPSGIVYSFALGSGPSWSCARSTGATVASKITAVHAANKRRFMIAPQSECPCFGEQRASPPQIYLTTKRATQSKGKSRGT